LHAISKAAARILGLNRQRMKMSFPANQQWQLAPQLLGGGSMNASC